MRLYLTRPTIIDDRGERHRVLYGQNRLVSTEERGRLPWGDFVRVRRLLGGDDVSIVRNAVMHLIIAGLLTGAAMLIGRMSVIPVWPALILWIVIGGVLVLMSALQRFELPLNERGELRRAFLHIGRCAACAEALPEQPDADGLHTCSTCLAAWRMDPVCCLRCGYALDGLRVDENFDVQCPECGAKACLPVLHTARRQRQTSAQDSSPSRSGEVRQLDSDSRPAAGQS